MKYTFDVQADPDYPEFFSVYLDNNAGSGAEVAGKIGYQELADHIAGHLNSLPQSYIHWMFRLPVPTKD